MINLIVENKINARVIQLTQDITYDGLLEGEPSEIVNQIVINNIKQRAKKILEIEDVYILNSHEKSKFSDNKFELPRITCIALLKSNEVFKNNEMDFSCLGLIWFQDELAFPISNSIIDQIKKINYKELCSEYEY